MDFWKENVMVHKNYLYKVLVILIVSCFILNGCSKKNTESTSSEVSAAEISVAEIPAAEIPVTEAKSEDEDIKIQEPPETKEPDIVEIHLQEYFQGIDGSAVIYFPSKNSFWVYNQKMAAERRSPCSTFKIISSLAALENKLITPDDSTRKWSKEVFWNSDWNKDIGFLEAFQTSCVWYYREIVNEIGKEKIQQELTRLNYGNCDISDWEGRLNTNNHNPALTGFWIESSLKISPLEQTKVLEKIFGPESDYSRETRDNLKEAMAVQDIQDPDLSIYGKTGMGKDKGVVVDAWFVGFADAENTRCYFAVYLGETADQNVSSTKAKEIAINVISDLTFFLNP